MFKDYRDEQSMNIQKNYLRFYWYLEVLCWSWSCEVSQSDTKSRSWNGNDFCSFQENILVMTYSLLQILNTMSKISELLELLNTGRENMHIILHFPRLKRNMWSEHTSKLQLLTLLGKNSAAVWNHHFLVKTKICILLLWLIIVKNMILVQQL